jgi:hypothetical protein
MAVTGELIRAIRDVQLVDELFQWLSPTIVRRFDVQVVQIWVAQIDYQGQCFMKLQALSSQGDSLPQRVALNKPFADLAGEIRSWQTELALSHIGNVFTSFQATLLQRYGLYYCFAEYLTGQGQSPSVSNLAGQGTLKPMEAVALLFFSQPPHPEIQRSISYVLKLAIQLAETNGLLLPPSGAQSNAPGYKLQLRQKSSSALSELVPHRTEDTNLMTTSSPLSDSIVISDKKARRLYSVIDGRNNVMELCRNTHLDLEEITIALQLLLAGRHILLCDSSGQVVDSSQYLNGL